MLKLNWELWLYGLFAGVIGGGATAGLSWAGFAAAHQSGMNVPVLHLNSLWIVLLCGAGPSFFAYLQKQPLPPILTTESTTTVTVKETKPAEPPASVSPPPPKTP